MPQLTPRCSRTRGLASAACIVACAICISVNGAASEDEESAAHPPFHPYLAPALSLGEMASGDLVERTIEYSARILFPKLAKASLPDTEFGVLVLPSFTSPHVVLFRDSDGETLVEKREIDPDEWPGITTSSKALPAEIATASISALRRALANARPPPRRGMRDGVSYYFFSRGTAGRADTPGADTEAGRLVGLVSALLRFVEGKAEDGDLRLAVENALRANHGSMENR